MTDKPINHHLAATRQLAEQLADHPDSVLVDALTNGFGNLESLIRNQPDDHPVINAGPLDEFPITKTFVNMLENAMPNYVTRADAAAATAAASIVCIKALEAQIRALAARIDGK
ncbi:hypothetical protein H7I53_14525 [Mycolicibacterium pulveris]|uniref:Uncharacterized protein n=1 Tax=Mycolicibacterium pulveris TaxID=36813 RepID=A0A7I7UL44_MYCPV|nr:hypothetical protein [Mycolicibacterium pulveris]MCV6981437.1 hypothetical protein [Mycolicibacterium pulveris]BBY82105.1 hypothetical protein MPUL_32630 [Mycolicibacterium pulveris]